VILKGKYRPYAFTEHGALQAANVLRSPAANETSKLIIRAFVALRDRAQQQGRLWEQIMKQLEQHSKQLEQHDAEIAGVIKWINDLTKMLKAEAKDRIN
jgi:hypothetical protein